MKNKVITQYYETPSENPFFFVIDSSQQHAVVFSNGDSKPIDIPKYPERKVLQSNDKRYLIFTRSQDVQLLDVTSQKLKTIQLENEMILDAFFSPIPGKLILCSRNYHNYIYDIGSGSAKLFYKKDYLSSNDYTAIAMGDVFSANELFFSNNGSAFIIKNQNYCSLFDATGNLMVNYDVSLLGNAMTVNLSPAATKFLIITDDNVIRQIYTPAGIKEWLQNSTIPALSEKLKVRYSLN